MNLLLDSGAYSAFTQGKTINLNEYIKFAIDKSKYVSKVVNLDVIKPNDPEVAAKEGRENFLQMRDSGVNSIPVWHARENFKWLDYMIDECDYVGLSFTSLVSPIEARIGSRLVWNYITDSKGYPIVKTHGFGDTSEYTLLTQPFTSVDSATWIIVGGRAARIRLQGKSYQLRSNSIGDTNFILDTDTGLKRESWEQEISSLGLNPDAVMKAKGKQSQLAMMRAYLVASDLLNLKEQTADLNRFRRTPSLFHSKYSNRDGLVREGPVKIYFVVSPSAAFMNFPVLASLGITDILVSYYYIVTSQKSFWDEYMLPFMENPVNFCSTHIKVKVMWDFLQEVLLKPTEVLC